jgi:hypothetical protein
VVTDLASGLPMLELGGRASSVAMPALERAVLYLFWLTIVAHLALYLRLRHEGLHRVYRFFAAFLLFRVVRATLLAALPPLWGWLVYRTRVDPFANSVYGWIWLLTEPVLWVFYILIVLEVYSRVLERYKGIESLGRWAVLAGLAVSLVLASLTLPVDLSGPQWQELVLRYTTVALRGVVSGLVVFLLFATGFLLWVPVPVSRNSVVHTLVYTLYFLLLSLSIFIANVQGSGAVALKNLAMCVTTLACLAMWGRFLNREGESKTLSIRHKWAPEQEQHLIEQLAAINASLLRTVPK